MVILSCNIFYINVNVILKHYECSSLIHSLFLFFRSFRASGCIQWLDRRLWSSQSVVFRSLIFSFFFILKIVCVWLLGCCVNSCPNILWEFHQKELIPFRWVLPTSVSTTCVVTVFLNLSYTDHFLYFGRSQGSL